MRNIIAVVITLFISISSFAQQGINYKALIKDDLGNIVANNPNVTIQFEILRGSPQNSVYRELHSSFTDANGITSVNIGEGALLTGSPTFSTIDWGSDEHFLNVKINTGSGLTDMGTTAFKTVPYALSSMDNQWLVNGNNISTKNSGNTGIGENNPTAKLDVNGNLRLQLGTSVNEFSTDGNFSGNSNNAIPTESAVKTYVDNSGVFQTINNVTRNSGGSIATNDFLFGSTQLNYNGDETRKFFFDKSKGAIRGGFVNGTQWNTQNIGDFSTAFGFITEAVGDRSTALGSGTIASRFASTAIGNYNLGDSDGLFMIGNGTSDGNRNNAFVVKSNGDTVLDGELNTTSTGNANMVAIAYGTIASNGDISTGSSNFTVTKPYTGTYDITINNEVWNSTDYITVLSRITNTSGFIKAQTGTSGYFRVTASNYDNVYQNTAFSFVIYKP